MIPGISSSMNYFGLPGNDYGLVDKQSQAVGMSEVNLKTDTPRVTQKDNLFFFDSRDCFGELSLRQAQLAFAYDAATTGKIDPERFKQSLNTDGIVVPERLVNIVKQLNNEGIINGFPERNEDETPWVTANRINFKFSKILKFVKSFEIINAIIPRDIIPIYVYFPGFINNCLPFTLPGTGITYLNPNVTDPSSTWESPIPETAEDFFDSSIQGISSNKLGGVYQTPLRYWRAYTGPNCMPDPHTPPPYQLWNPPQDNLSDTPWPFQPVPVRGQRIPTYVARNGVVFAGYGLYDLEDFPSTQEVQLANGNNIRIPLRKLILKLIVPKGQFINGVSAESLIDISNVDDFNDSGIVDNPLIETGYGDYQRFIPGPGVAMNYQPNQWRDGKSAPIDLSCSTYDPDTGYLGPMPTPFPNFRGNVWGPYGRPGDRFQNKSLQRTVDELYLNGDTQNLEGNSIIFPNYNPIDGPYSFELFIATLKRSNSIVRFRNFQTSSNPNIRNAMRVEYDGGFGAVYAYVGQNTSSRGVPGPIITGGLPNTQYDGSFHKLNPDVWVTPREDNPGSWIQSLPGPQKPSIVSSDTFPGWIYIWRDIFPWTGSIYVPITAGGTGPMEYYDCDASSPVWKKSEGSSVENNLYTGSSQWACSPVIGQSNIWCIPSSNPAAFEFVANQNWGQVTSIELSEGGSGYQDSFPSSSNIPQYRFQLPNDINNLFGLIDVTSVDSFGTILTFNNVGTAGLNTGDIVTAVNCSPGDTVFCTNNITTPSTDNNAVFIVVAVDTVDFYAGGTGYSVGDDVTTFANTGFGTGLTVNILAVDANGTITDLEINDPGNAYVVGDILTIRQFGANNNATIRILDASAIPENLIPEYNVFHFTDPLAVGPANPGTLANVSQNYVNGVDTCTVDCPNNCTPPIGEFQFCIGERIPDTSTACNDPRPNPDPPCMLKCDFEAQEGPEIEWQNSINNNQVNKRPNDNVRYLQTNDFINRRVSYNDLGSNNGFFLTGLLNYQSFFVSSTPDTDLVIRIRQAERTVFTQSLNPTIDQSNFNIPIRLNLGTTSGTLEYVEAVQGTLTSTGVYWQKFFYPPLAKLGELTLELFTYDGTPIPVERCLGFLEQINDQAILFSSSITSAFILAGSYAAFAPNLPPFASTYTSTPSSVIVTGTNNSKTLSDPFNPRLERYTQRNLGLYFKMITYQGENPGITEIIKKMPDALVAQQTEKFTDADGDEQQLLPLAGNIDNYSL